MARVPENPAPGIPISGIPAPAAGRIDIHSHLLPGLDDGCADLEESLTCVRRLMEIGYTGTICTPHVIRDLFPQNTPANIQRWTAELQEEIHKAGLNYTLWPGGELRVDDQVIPWLEEVGVPTLAGSKFVLFDFWADRFPGWLNDVCAWLRQKGYRPLLAHPERLACVQRDPKGLERLVQSGVMLQGNFLSITGRDGFATSQVIRALIGSKRYRFLAMDMHRPESLGARLDGLALVAAEFGEDFLDEMTIHAPRRHLFNASTPT